MARCEDNFGGVHNCSRGWYDWGRWVALAVILIAAFLLFFVCAVISARRRRRMGRNPYRGTGWVPFAHGPAVYNPEYGNQQNQYAGPPQYTPNSNTGYYGGQNVEMQPPPNAYHGGDNVYSPPAGPPPGKK
ncbi:MAG: hypothetical protein Q9227_002341 [Pyrenula ochraceoflavens]